MIALGVAVKPARVLRGGSWNNPAGNLAASYRNRNHAGNRNNNIGFRLVVSLPREHASRPGAGESCRPHPGQPKQVWASETPRLVRSSKCLLPRTHRPDRPSRLGGRL